MSLRVLPELVKGIRYLQIAIHKDNQIEIVEGR
jgi:hypothetical protein